MVGDILHVRGPTRLEGIVRPGGFKHLLVVAVGAALLSERSVSITNCPDIMETRVLAQMLRGLGGSAAMRDGRLDLDLTAVGAPALDTNLSRSIHGTVYLLPGLLHRFGEVHLPLAGGCRIGESPGGERPIAQYVEVLRRFGVSASVRAGGVHARGRRLTGSTIDLRDFTTDRAARTGPLYSGATKCAVLCAVAAHGTSRLLHPYPKVDVTGLVDLLQQMGARIEYASPDEIIVDGHGAALLDKPVHCPLPADLIEVLTWLCLAAMTGCAVRIEGDGVQAALRGLAAELRVLDTMGVWAEGDGNLVAVMRSERLRPARVTVASHDVYSDSQPLIAVLSTHAHGRTTVHERVWRGRFGYATGLAQLGARVSHSAEALVVDGPCPSARADQVVTAGDLRAAAALLAAALGVPGRTVLQGAAHLCRGYADLPGALRALGADVQMADDPAARL